MGPKRSVTDFVAIAGNRSQFILELILSGYAYAITGSHSDEQSDQQYKLFGARYGKLFLAKDSRALCLSRLHY